VESKVGPPTDGGHLDAGAGAIGMDECDPSLLHQVREILGDIARNGAPAELVDAAKRHEVADAEFKKNSISDLAMFWSDAVALEGRNSPGDDIEAIQKVTVEDVKRVASRLLNQQESISAILTPQASDRPISSSTFGKPEFLAATENAAAPLPAWAQKVNQLFVPASNVRPQVTILSNGLKLIVQPETVSATVSVFGHVQNPRLKHSKGKEGVDEVLDELLSYGTASLDRAAFQKALDDIGLTNRPVRIFHSKCLPAILTAVLRCWRRMNYIRLCPPPRSKPSSASSPTAPREKIRARPT
jgi:zinc protease